MTRRLLAGSLAALLVVAACSSDKKSAGTTTTIDTTPTTTTAPATTSTTIAPTTTTTTPPTTTTTLPPTTTTTTPPGAALVMTETALGTAEFGAEPDGVVAYVKSFLGNPTTDTGWVDPASIGACPGTELRIVTWNDLSLYFSNESLVTTGRRHFFAYTYGPAFVPGQINPAGLATDAGIGIGSTVADLKATYPAAVVNPKDELGDANFFVDDGLSGFLTGTSDADTVTAVLGGHGCGE